jgi:glycosyltransferase involved in cell wall biosynthesis
LKRVLFLAYHFPPIGGAGVQRSVKFVRYLPELGYQPVVVTGPEARLDRWTPEDESLAVELPRQTPILRVQSLPPPVGSGWRDRAERWLGMGDAFRKWWVEGAVAVGAGQAVDLIYASMSPFESGTAAAELSRRLGKPWVADLRDPWALDEMQVYSTRLHRRLELRRMRSLLASAAAVVMNTEEAARLVRGFPGLEHTPVFAIPNGFDPDDFADSDDPPRREDGTFRIVHTGYLHTATGRPRGAASLVRRALGGSVAGVEIISRSHVFLLEAIDRLLARDPSLADRLELHLAGALSSEDLEAIGHTRIVRTPGYLPHRETTALLRSADLLFLPMHDLPPGKRATIVPGKTYEYLASERPILAAVPDGDARDLLARAGTAHLCRPRDVDCMVAAIELELRRVENGDPPPRLDSQVSVAYDRRTLTAQLARVFEAVLAPS